MFTKRPDKYTTGLINMRNDCFANSSIQAYSALPGLTEYLNKFILSFNDLSKFLLDNKLDINKIADETKADSNPKFKKTQSNFSIPLHISLAKIVKKLQSTQLTSRTISVWTFLHDLEKIFNAKISRSQHDAQELTQLINETLENEYLKITSKVRQLQADLAAKQDPSYSSLKMIEFPEFPLNGLILTQMRCLNCKGVSKPHFLQFLMLTLHAPETISTNLENLLDENESESIEGYQCLRCRIRYIVNNETYLKSENKQDLTDEESGYLEQLTKLNGDPNFCINDDLPEELEQFIKNYKKNNVDISKITSTVLRKNQILKPPKIFGLHLSRSSFNGVDVTRNSCRVSFRDHLNLSIGKEYLEDLKQFQLAAQDEESNLDATRAKTKVLTTDENDMEDEEIQREDIEESGPQDDSEDQLDTEGTAEDDDDLDDDTDSNSTSSTDTLPQKNISLQSSNSSNTTKTLESFNNSPITTDQSDHLINHFKKFKFSENDIYKYRLKAMIRHQGSHTQGHYECYKRKPLYVKDKDGMIIKLSPEILDEAVGEDDDAVNHNSTKFRRASMASSSSSEKEGSGKNRAMSSSSDRSDIMASLNEENIPEPPGAFRRKFSNMMGRRPSIFQADPESVKIEEIIPSGLTTPAELLVQEVDKDQGYFGSTSELTEHLNTKLKEEPQEAKNVKLKKIPSMLKNPYWRISDSIITEVSKAAVLVETTSVYMLYYERIEK